MATHAGGFHVTLVGGILDGDKIALVPNGSLGPPHQLSYADVHHTGDKSESCWLVYGMDYREIFSGRGWPDKDEFINFYYLGKFSLDYSRQLCKSSTANLLPSAPNSKSPHAN